MEPSLIVMENTKGRIKLKELFMLKSKNKLEVTNLLQVIETKVSCKVHDPLGKFVN